MKKRVQAIAVLIAMMVSMLGTALVDMVEVKAASEITINYHYLRTDGNYADWDVWTWYDGGEGTGVTFGTATDANGVTATMKVDASVKEVGYIVRRGGSSWSEKDPTDGDNFLDISTIIGGTVDVYVVSKSNGGDGSIEVNYDKGTKASGALITAADGEGSSIFVTFSEAATSASASDFVVKDSTGAAVNVTKVNLESDKKSAEVVLASEVDPAKSYSIEFNGVASKVEMPDYFSSMGFEKEFTYDGDDLGATWSKKSTTFKVWAPTATSVKVLLFKTGDTVLTDLEETIDMKKGDKGVWSAKVDGDLNGKYYLYEVAVDGATNRVCDPYAKAVGINGGKSMVIDLDSTDPKGWDKDEFVTVENVTDAIIYELHVRDFSSDPNSGIKNTGKYLAFTEKGTKTSSGFSTGLDYLIDLGVNFVHLLPTYDFGSVDEKNPEGKYNWGYDPVNYFALEGSYATDAADGAVRINEYKQMVQSLHDNNIGVISDVVFNHVYQAGSFSYNKIVPGYYTREGSNGSGCGNDVASERSMVRKHIVDCVKYWQDEYHIDGYRFDLMGLLDVETMNAVSDTLAESNPNVIIYGEGWTLGTKVTKSCDLAVQASASMTNRIAYFSDNIRDAIKGSVFSKTEPGYVAGGKGKLGNIVTGVQGAPNWATNPTDVVNYASAHDNNTLWDKLQLSAKDASEEDRVKMNNLSAAIVYMSQGIPFTMSGEEGLKTKVKEDGSLDENSYKSSDAVNMLDYGRADEMNKKYGVYDYFKGLIEFRKNHSALRMTTAEDVKKNVVIENLDTAQQTNTLEYSIKQANGEVADALYIVFNANNESVSVDLPSGDWNLCINGEKAGTDVIEKCSGTVEVDPISCFVFVQGETKMKETASDAPTLNKENNMLSTSDIKKKEDTSGKDKVLLWVLSIGTAILAFIGVFIYFTANKKHISTLKTQEDIIGPKSENRLLDDDK